MKASLQWKWFGALAAFLLILLLVLNLCVDHFLFPYLFQKIQDDLERNAALTSEAMVLQWKDKSAKPEETNLLAHALSKRTGLRITVIAADGKVIAESDKSPNELGSIQNHLHRPEVQEALRTGMGHATRHSDTTHVDFLYVAVVAKQNGGDRIVRVSLPLTEIQRTTHRIQNIVATGSLFVGIVAIPFLFWMTSRISRPMDQMRLMANRVAKGDFAVRAPQSNVRELNELGKSLNEMTSQLERQLRELNEEREELHATLSNMIEGVLLVDTSGKIRLVNHALLGQFQLSDVILGKTVMEVFRNAPLHDLVMQTLKGEPIRDRELSFGVQKTVFHINAVRLAGANAACIGAIIVFHDITRLKQLENIRKDFVANVSHELRTPLSIIKGYLETLLDESPPDEKTSKQFLRTVQKHSDRLETLIQDLLTISALESHNVQLKLEPISLGATAAGIVAEFEQQAKKKSISVVLEISNELPSLKVDIQRIHQVFFNLLDNAMKYTPENGRICVSAKEKNGEIEVCVSDNGPGISSEHLPHLFERFYRVDRARSREQGGTGLGLSIVKHIVQSHKGRVWAESQVGKGSSFFFTLPKG